MAYTNFDDAWFTCNVTFPDVQTNMVNLYNEKLGIVTGITLATLITKTRKCFNYIYNAVINHVGCNWLDPINESWHMMALYYAGQGAVDMDGILNAMLQADYDQLQKFIGLEDAYRSAIWNQPFNAEFYASLARGFLP
jgi:hypothetical protein